MDVSMKMKMLRDMIRIRMFEEKMRDLFVKGDLPGFLHLYLGEEAVAVGVCSALETADYIFSTHRGHGHLIAKGADMKKMAAELFGKSTGYNKGKGGSMHIAAPKLGIMGANGIVGGGIPLAAGAAFSAKYLNNHKVSVCFFGDGASNEGTFHEALNIASAFDLPCIFVCENNLYGATTRYSAVSKTVDIASRASAYSMPGVTVDGNNVEEIYEIALKAVHWARTGQGPTLIECKTYRWQPHCEGISDAMRTNEEKGSWKAMEPIKRYKEVLLRENLLTDAILSEIEHDVVRELDDAIEYAKKSPEPTQASAIDDVYLA